MQSAKAAPSAPVPGCGSTGSLKADGAVGRLTFAQLSDPHLSSLDAVALRDLLNKRILGYLSWQHRRSKEHRPEVLVALSRDLHSLHPDHLVVTGDLTNIGLPEEMHQARQWLETLGQAHSVTVIPGNHDAYAHRRWDSSFSAWSPFMESDDIGSVDAGPVGFPILRVRGPVAFIGLSSAQPSAPFFATGRLGPEQLLRTEQLLQETGRRGLFRVVMVHHPPRPGDEKWRKRLTDGEQLCSLVARYGAELLLHGHTHRALRSEIETAFGRVPVFGIPSSSAIGRRAEYRARYNLYRVERRETGWALAVSVRGYVASQDRFCREHEHHLQLPYVEGRSS